MPISIGDVAWSQTEDFVKIRIKLHSPVSVKSLDIFTHSEYLKVSSPPFFREIFLFQPIDTSKSKCRVIDRCIYFELKKKETINWTTFDVEPPEDTIVRKQDIIAEQQTKEQEGLYERLQLRADIKRQDMLTEIDRINLERKQEEEVVQQIRKMVKPKLKPIPIKPRRFECPPVRQTGSIAITFSDRVFTTPKRESQTEVEQNWLAAQREAKRSVGFAEEDLREEERDPNWLLLKGNEFYSHKNYKGAISAYSTGIKLNPNSVELHLNRAGAQLEENNYMRCAEDCSKALDLLEKQSLNKDDPASYRNIRIRCLKRRGVALCKMGLLREAWGELHAAWEMDKTDKKLSQDMDEILKQMSD